METKAAFRSAMVSRLPKFGGRSSNKDTNTLPNALTPPTPPPQDGKTNHPNGVIRAPSISLKWKKDEALAPTCPTTAGPSEDKPKTLLPSTTKEVKNASPGTPKIRRSGSLMVAVSSPKSVPKHVGKPTPKIDHKQSQSQLNGSAKVSPGEAIQLGSDPVRPKLRSSSPRSSSQDSLSQSSDSFKSLALDNMVRSNSFTHFKQNPSPTNQPMTRSFSFNRAVELAKPLANTQLRPPRNSLLKPPQMSNCRVGLGLGGLNANLSGSGGLGTGLGGFNYSRTTASSLPTLSTPSAPSTPGSLKKPLLPNCVLNKSLNGNGGSIGYKLPRTAPIKQQPLFPGQVKEKLQPLVPGGLLGITIDTEAANKAEKADFYSDSDGSAGETNGLLRQSLGETLEEMSLSSASSLDRGDISEEFLDDFDSTEDVLCVVDTAENTKSGQSHLQSLLNEAVDWPLVKTTETKETSPMEESCGSLVLSPESSHVPPGSSMELSPSNSSGGTYMWDEDGLEPLGGPASHPYDSYSDADLNSIDILNNLDPGAGELEEDDLMLDVDLPEDRLHETDRLSLMERSERGRPGQRRKHHRWSAPDHFHNNSRMHGYQHYDGFKAPRFTARPFYSDGKQHGHTPVLDELTLEHMSQDCSSLKNHLLRLKNLLQLEDADSPAHAIDEDAEDNSTALQLQELIKEVQELREELKSRDRTIAQLTLQCQQLQQQQQEQMPAHGHQVRCQCQRQRAPSSLQPGDQQMDRRTKQQHDKTTQTYWRPPTHTPQILQPFNPFLKELRHQGRLTRAASTAGHSDRAPAHSEDCAVCLEHKTADVSCPTDPEQLAHLLSAQVHWLDPRRGVTGGDGAASEILREPPAPTVSPGSMALMCPRVLQPPRLHKRVLVPALKPGGAVHSPRGSQLLPPPSRGLPCFNTGPRVQALSVCRTSVLQPYRDLQSTDCSPGQLNRGKLREPATAKIPIPTSGSCLPKPKVS